MQQAVTKDNRRAGTARRWCRRGLFALAIVVGLLGAWRWSPWYSASDSSSEMPYAVGETAEKERLPLEGAEARHALVKYLDAATTRAASLAAFQARFTRRERLGKKLGDWNQFDVTARQKPLGICMRWIAPSPGQELFFLEGSNNGRVWMRAAPTFRALLPDLHLAPDSPLVLQASRYSATSGTLWGLLERAREHLQAVRADLELQVRFAPETQMDDRRCDDFTLVHTGKGERPAAQKRVVHFDRQTGLLIGWEMYDWPPDDRPEEAPLVESYLFSRLALDVPVGDQSFQPQD